MTKSPLTPSRAFPLVLLLFAASGCAALIYEVVWYQLLQLAIGSTAVSLGVLLATFMGGLCLGSLLLPRLRRDAGHPLIVYALIEFGIALCGLAVLWGLPLVDQLYVAGVQHGLPGMLARGAICAVCLLAPTFLMGASLPAISRFVAASPRGVSRWGWLYAGNTAGAVSGCLLAGFYLLRLHDLGVATYAAMAINIVVALASWGLAKAAPTTQPAVAPAPTRHAVGGSENPWPVYWTIAISGATALGAEVVWTRLLGMMFGGTVYAFSIILAVFLVGLALGSGVGSALLRVVRPRPALAWSQLLLAGAIAWATYMITQVLPYQPELLSQNGWDVASGDLLRALAALLPASLLWGASFPLAMAAAAGGDSDPARPVGAVYAANTFGGIVGALSVSLVLVAWIGTRDTQRVMLVSAALSGLILLVPILLRTRAPLLACGLAVALVLTGLLTWTLPEQPGDLVAYGRQLPMFAKQSKILEVVEGRNSSIAISKYADGTVQISVGGHVEATTEIYDMRLQRMVGHLPALLHPHPVKVLGIGFGAGVSAGSFTRYPSVTSITVCELEPMVPPTSSRYFHAADNNVLHDPRTHIVYDDARHFIQTTPEKFDIIASDPLDVWVKGTASIYSLDYFEMIKKHLNPGGYFSLYVPLYESDEATVRSEIATFFRAFPNGTIWANTADGQGYDLVLMGQAAPLRVDLDVVETRLRQPAYAPVLQSLRQINFNSASEMYATYAGQQSDIAGWLQGAEINNDRNLRLMYLAGWGINSHLEDALYKKIISLRQPPRTLFTGSIQAIAQFSDQMLEQADPERN